MFLSKHFGYIHAAVIPPAQPASPDYTRQQICTRLNTAVQNQAAQYKSHGIFDSII
jgi:hypothetical protein